MLKNTKNNLRVIVLIIVMVLIMCQPAFIPSDVSNGDEPEIKSVLAFTSDVHDKEPANTSAKRLGRWIDRMIEKYGHIDAFSFGGDMGDYNASESRFWRETQAVMDTVDKKGVEGIFTTGNHEYDPGNFMPEKSDVTRRYTLDSEAKEGVNYRIYCMGSESKVQGYSAQQIAALKRYLQSIGNDKPIFIVTHFPLHYDGINSNKTRETVNAAAVIDALNLAVTSGTPTEPSDDKKIVFLWGHNHTRTTSSRSYYDRVYRAGERIQTSSTSGSKKRLRFYYAAAGCMSDSEYSSGSHAVKGKGLIITINGEDLLTFTYHDEYARDVTVKDPFHNGIDGTAFGPGASIETAEKAIASLKSDSDPGGTMFAPLHAHVKKTSRTSAKVTWKKVKGAKKYIVYGNKCGKKNRMKRIKAVTGKSLIVKKVAEKKLKKKTSYKFLVIAVDTNNNVVSTSKIVHVRTKGSKKGNYKKVKITRPKKAMDGKFTIRRGKTVKVKAKAVGKKVKAHRKLMYESLDQSIATVGARNGRIKGIKKGTVKIKIYAANGVYKTIKLRVK